MKIMRAEHLGMCFGVKDAIALAQATAQAGQLTVLGELVHNETVQADLRARGIRIAEDPAAVRTPTVMITAHGTSERRLNEARGQGLKVLEATCPLVHAAHRALAKLVGEGFYPVVIGKPGHVEVRGLTEDLAECTVIETAEEIVRVPLRPRYGVISQTTQPIDHVRRLVQLMRESFPTAEVRFIDTVCQPTKQRQGAAVELAQRCNIVIVIGGANSNNTRELVQTCLRYCRRVHHVQHTGDLRPAWFQPDDIVGITAGTSTPDETIEAIEHWLQDQPVSAMPLPNPAAA